MTMPEATAEEVIAIEWLHPHYATPDGKQRMNFQGFVVQAPGRVIVVDTCIGAGRERDFDVFCDLPEGFIEDLGSLGITREDVDTVMCTHLHFDHVGWNTYKDPATGEFRPTFPNARYLFGKTEYDAWQKVHAPRRRAYRHPPVECVDPIVAAGMADFIEADHRDRAESRLRAEPRPHARPRPRAASTAQGRSAVITGDLMHHPMQCAMPHRDATFDMDKDGGRANRGRLRREISR